MLMGYCYGCHRLRAHITRYADIYNDQYYCPECADIARDILAAFWLSRQDALRLVRAKVSRREYTDWPGETTSAPEAG